MICTESPDVKHSPRRVAEGRGEGKNTAGSGQIVLSVSVTASYNGGASESWGVNNLPKEDVPWVRDPLFS